MSQALAIALADSALVTAAGSGASVDIGTLRRTVLAALSVTSWAPVDSDPVPSLTVTVETRSSETSPWRAVDALSMEGLGAYELAVGGLDRYVRVSWALTNMTGATFAVNGVSHVTYCDPSDLPRAVSEPAIQEITASARVRACVGASERFDRYANGSFVLPLTAWGDDVRLDCAKVAAADIFRARGDDPAGPDKNVFATEDAVMSDWRRIADGKLKPPGIVDSTPTVFEGGGYVTSRPSSRRSGGW